MKTIVFLSLSVHIVALSAFCADGPMRSIEDLSADYADFLTNVTFQLRHADVFEDSLNSFRKAEDYSPDAMLKALVSIVEKRHATTNDVERRMARAAINAMGCLRLTNALPILNEWTLGGGDIALSSFCAYGEVCDNDKRYLNLGIECVSRGVFSLDYLTLQLCSILTADNQGRLSVPLDEPTRVRMQKTILDSAFKSPPSRGELDSYFCQLIPGYSNSQERVVMLQRILDNIGKIPRPREGVRQLYLFPYDKKGYEYDDLTNKVRTICEVELARIQKLPNAAPNSMTEIARSRSIPIGERLNMTAILDAQIAAIEEAEARAARRAIWRRRLRNAGLLLPIPVIVFVVVLVRRKRNRRIALLATSTETGTEGTQFILR